MGFLNRIIEGQAYNPVGYYFAKADGLFFALNIAFWVVLTCTLLIATNVHINLKISILGFMGVVLMYICTFKYGIGISPDSVIYISAGRNLLKGLGLSRLSGSGDPIAMTGYPPLFPILLSLTGLLGVPFLDGARWLNIFLFGANILLVGLMINRYTRSILISIFGSFLMLTSIDMLNIHSMAWTEPLFIFFMLLGLFLLAVYIENRKLLLFIASSSAIALAFLARYVGVALVATGIAGIFFFTKKRWPRRIVDSIAFAIISSLPVLLWMIRNFYFTGSATGIRIGLHFITFWHFVSAGLTFSRWLLPASIPFIRIKFLLLVETVGLLVLGMLLLKRRLCKSNFTKQYLIKLPYLLGIFILVYAALLVISISFYAVNTPLDSRILSPVYVTGLVLVICLSYKLLYSTKHTGIFKVASIIICIVFAGFYLLSGARWIANTYNNGQGYASKAWKQSEIIQKVKALPSGILIYTNAPDAIHILTGRYAFMIPGKVNAVTMEINDSYLSEIAEMEKSLKNKGGVLVYLDKITWRWYLPSENELKKQLLFHLLTRDADGSIYGVKY